MQVELIREEAREFLNAANDLVQDPEDGKKREETAKNSVISCLFAISLPLLSTSI